MVFYYNAEELRFKTISEFKRSIKDGGEIVIEWDGRSYGIFFNGTQFYMTSQDGSTVYFQTADELLERLTAYGCAVYRTDLDGTLIFRR